ncbi:hypothetical protein J7E87_04640 [Streptomyces sp. ISL-1]|uniref:hypothetical protein n=1 Tax=Streptomyces sp. ISL-1 TaxID=2817657 RepID=UPI001BED0257|nr:hypothetical protein [Streptomyces sp. ISL-1]MBT2388724.1 hypothetical protein [Streptomyces sp. ISL-1]
MSPATPVPQSGGPALELLVHGVGGATPQDMLGDPRTVRISGDEKAAVFRRTDDEEAERHPERYTDRPIPEAYCWSNLTSGNGARALWLLLLPFMVVNLAHWMRPRAKGRARTTRLYGVLVRLVALSLTVLLTAAACEVALDLLAWQCAGSPDCTRESSWLGFLSSAQGGWWSQPGRRLALAAVVPAALVGLLWYLSSRTWSAYESQRPPTGDDVGEGEAGPGEDTDEDADAGEGTDKGAGKGRDKGEGESSDKGKGKGTDKGEGEGASEAKGGKEPVVRPALGRPGFWYGRRLVARLRAAHTAAGFLTVSAAVAGAAARHDRRAAGTALEVCGLLLEAALVVGLLAVLWVVIRRGRSERRIDARIDRAAVRLLPGGALVLLALSLLYASWSRPGWVSTATLPGDVTFRVIALVQGALVVSLAVAAWLLHRRARHPRTAMTGLGGPAVAMLACALGGVMTGGVAQRVADWLDGSGTPGMDGEGSIPGPPVLLSWQASVIPVLLIVLFVPAVVLAVRTWLKARRLAGPVEADYDEARPDTVRTRRIAGTRARAALTDAAPWIVGIVSGATLLLGAGAVAGAWASGEVPGKAFGNSAGFVESAAEAAQSVGSWLIGFGFILFVTWGRRAYRDASARRTIGILWDVGTFWPRAAHPFAPPCYAERAVPDLTWRMCTWIGLTGGRLVISGHSQGSVLAAAAVWQLPPATRRRVALLTYGSPLERLYGRWFPAYFGPVALRELRSEVNCWRNLWRRTDPIGGPVLVPAEGGHLAVDRDALKDPVVYGRSERHPLPEPILGHSEYQADKAFDKERRELLDRLTPAVPRQVQAQVQAQTQTQTQDQGSSGRSSG